MTAHVSLFFSYAFFVRSLNSIVDPTQVVYMKKFKTRMSTYAPGKKEDQKKNYEPRFINTIQRDVVGHLPMQALPFFHGVAQWYNRLNGARIARKLRHAIAKPRLHALVS